MTEALHPIDFPELVFAIAGPIGVDVEAITKSIQTTLFAVGYRAEQVKLTKEMLTYATNVPKPSERDFYSETKYKMDYANSLCSTYQSRAALAMMAVRAIRNRRRLINRSHQTDCNAAIGKMAYIVRQLKRPQEVELLRKVYGRQFYTGFRLWAARSEKSNRSGKTEADPSDGHPTKCIG